MMQAVQVTPGLSDYANALEGAAASVQALVEFALEKVRAGTSLARSACLLRFINQQLMLCPTQVPAASRPVTPIHLLATAGLRLLPKQQSEEVLDTVRGVLGKSGFLFKLEWARILPGELEGLYAWAAFNFASGTLQVSPSTDHC
jgi:Golgi nucleoside diphosphatase